MSELHLINPQVPQPDDDGPPFTVSEVAAKLGYKKSTIYTMIEQKILGCVRPPGMDIRIYPKHIREYRERFECPAQPLSDQTTGSANVPADENGTSPGPTPANQNTAARALRFRQRSTKARMNRSLAKRHDQP